METDKNPFELIRTMMIENLEKSRSATQNYLDMIEKTMRGFPNAREDQIGVFKAYIERQVAANHAFVDKLLRAKDFPEAFRIEVEYFQAQLADAAENVSQFGVKLANPFKRSEG
jgi:Phasin protein